jgi:hypothetical protein
VRSTSWARIQVVLHLHRSDGNKRWVWCIPPVCRGWGACPARWRTVLLSPRRSSCPPFLWGSSAFRSFRWARIKMRGYRPAVEGQAERRKPQQRMGYRRREIGDGGRKPASGVAGWGDQDPVYAFPADKRVWERGGPTCQQILRACHTKWQMDGSSLKRRIGRLHRRLFATILPAHLTWHGYCSCERREWGKLELSERREKIGFNGNSLFFKLRNYLMFLDICVLMFS